VVSGGLRFRRASRTSGGPYRPAALAHLTRGLDAQPQELLPATLQARRRGRRPPAETRIHDLRHPCAALCIALGAHPKAIQERLGHSSITVTLDRYGHLFPKLDETLTARLDDMREAAAHRLQ
jgi:integrase